jgi:hypothetical protein
MHVPNPFHEAKFCGVHHASLADYGVLRVKSCGTPI